jgi:hypothetical protein
MAFRGEHQRGRPGRRQFRLPAHRCNAGDGQRVPRNGDGLVVARIRVWSRVRQRPAGRVNGRSVPAAEGAVNRQKKPARFTMPGVPAAFHAEKRDSARLMREWRSHADRRPSAERRRPDSASPAMASMFQDGRRKKSPGFSGAAVSVSPVESLSLPRS